MEERFEVEKRKVSQGNGEGTTREAAEAETVMTRNWVRTCVRTGAGGGWKERPSNTSERSSKD